MRLGIFLLFALSVNGFFQAPEPQRQLTLVVGTKVSLEAPEGFTRATQFPGFWHEPFGSSIMVTEFPAPLAEISSGLSDPAQFKQKGMSLLNRQAIKVDGHSGFILKVKQSAFGIEYLKWLLVFGDDKESVIVTAMFPSNFERELSETMKLSILTTTWDRKKDVSPTEGLNFTIEEKGELKLSRRMVNMLTFTKTGRFPSKDIDDPVFIVGQSTARIQIVNPEEFAKARIAQTATLTDLEIEQTTKVTLDQLQGYEIVATAKDKDTGQPMTVYQVILFEEQSYFLMQGLISSKNRQPNLETFREMAKTFRRGKF